ATRFGKYVTTAERTSHLCFAGCAIASLGLDQKAPFSSRQSVDRSEHAMSGTLVYVPDLRVTSSSSVSTFSCTAHSRQLPKLLQVLIVETYGNRTILTASIQFNLALAPKVDYCNSMTQP